jgi:hypothetical protein
MTITAKYNSLCPECGGIIERGESVEWIKGRKALHIECAISGGSEREEQHARYIDCGPLAWDDRDSEDY